MRLRKNSKYLKPLVLTVLLASYCVFFTSFDTTLIQMSVSSYFHRALSTTSSSSLLITSYEHCSIPTITLPSDPIIPVFAASYPGSGSQMAHYLYEALTGYEAGDEWMHRGDTYDRITIKTHYPARQHQVEGSRLMYRAILLIRNPLHALPSHHNYIYEKENGIPNHTVRAPKEAWIRWRDEHFQAEIYNWSNHITYWVSKFESDKRLIVGYENLIHHKIGPIETMRIASFLSRSDGVNTIPAGSIPCIWDRVVNYKEIDEQEHKLKKEEEQQQKQQQQERQEEKSLESEQQPPPLASTSTETSETAQAGRRKSRRMLRYTDHSNYVSKEDPTHPVQSLREGHVKYEFTRSQLETIKSVLNGLRGHFIMEYTLVILLSKYIEEVNDELKKFTN